MRAGLPITATWCALSVAFVACSLTSDLDHLEGSGSGGRDSGGGGAGVDSALEGAPWIDAPADAPSDTPDVTAPDVTVADAGDEPAPEAAADSGPTYADEVLSDHPALYYRLDEKVGPTAHDASGHGHDGTYLGSVVFEAPGAIAGSTNTGVDLTGGYIDAGDILDFAGLATFTLEIWVQWNGAPYDYPRLFSKESQLSSRTGWEVMLDTPTAPRILFERWQTLSSDSIVVTKTLPTSSYAYVVASFDGATMKLYVDATELATKPSSLSLSDTTATLKIGAYSSTANKLGGAIDEVAIYDTALPLSRIQAHYARALSGG